MVIEADASLADTGALPNKPYAFVLTAGNIPDGVAEVRFEWAPGFGVPGSLVVPVRAGSAVATVEASYPAAGRYDFAARAYRADDATAAAARSTAKSSGSASADDGGGAWDALPPEVREAFVVLGYTEEIWDADGDVPSQFLTWGELSAAQREAAETVGYDGKEWDEEVFEDAGGPATGPLLAADVLRVKVAGTTLVVDPPGLTAAEVSVPYTFRFIADDIPEGVDVKFTVRLTWSSSPSTSDLFSWFLLPPLMKWTFGVGNSGTGASDTISAIDGRASASASQVYALNGTWGLVVDLRDADTGAILAQNSVAVAVGRSQERTFALLSCGDDRWSNAYDTGEGVTVDTWDVSAIPIGAVFDVTYQAYKIPDKFLVDYPPGGSPRTTHLLFCSGVSSVRHRSALLWWQGGGKHAIRCSTTHVHLRCQLDTTHFVNLRRSTNPQETASSIPDGLEARSLTGPPSTPAA